MKKTDNKDKVRQFFEASASEADWDTVKKIFENEEHSDELKQILHEHWNELEEAKLQEQDLSPIFYKLYYQITHEKSSAQKKADKQWWYYYKNIAAVFLPLLLLVNIYFFSLDINITQTDNYTAQSEIVAPTGSRVHFQLPDGSTVWLNGGSSIKYPGNFSENRLISLKGEAYFDVEKKDNPFVVEAKEMSISVLGTKFNVSAYQALEKVEVVLESGKVKLKQTHGAREIEMKPNDKVVIDTESKQINITEVDPLKFTSWKEGKLIFRNDDLKDIKDRLETWYNIEIVIHNQENKDISLRATFIDETLEEVLKLINLSFPIEYEIQERAVNPNGELQKKKVTIHVL